MSILDSLRSSAKTKAKNCETSLFTLRGLWNTEYLLQTNEKERIFRLKYIMAQTIEMGCCYYDTTVTDPILELEFLGKNALNLDSGCQAIDIAALDSAYGILKGKSGHLYSLYGTSIEKSYGRAKIVCDEALRLLTGITGKNGQQIAVINVGVVGNILNILSQYSEWRIVGTDFDKTLIGTTLHGITIDSGLKTLEHVAAADLAIITGMTLWNGSMDEILKTATANHTQLVVFAETGANFAEEYCKLGIDVVISEPFPFYLSSNGLTTIEVFRRDD